MTASETAFEPFALDIALENLIDTRTKKDLKFESLPKFDRKMHKPIATLSDRMKRLYATTLHLTWLVKRDITAEQLFMYEHMLVCAHRKFLVEIGALYPKYGMMSGLGVCRGGKLVRVLGTTKDKKPK